MTDREERLQHLATLKQGWYEPTSSRYPFGLGAPITPESIEAARMLIPVLEAKYPGSVIRIFPTTEGGISLERGFPSLRLVEER